MINFKKLSIIAIILLIIGIAGSLFTFKPINKNISVLEEKAITADFKEMDIGVNNAKVEIIPTNDSTTTVELSGTEDKKPNYTFTADVKETTLSVHLKERQRKMFHFNFYPRLFTLNVYVPKKQYDLLQIRSDNGRVNAESLNIKAVNVQTNNGRIELKNITGSTLAAEADNGRIIAEKIDVKEIEVKTDNGRIDLEQVDSSNVMVKANNGKISLDDIEGKISGKVNNGGISLITNHLDRPIEFESDNGSIKIQTENEPTNATIDASVHNGKINIFGNENRNTVFGNGDNLIRLTTHNGRITVTK